MSLNIKWLHQIPNALKRPSSELKRDHSRMLSTNQMRLIFSQREQEEERKRERERNVFVKDPDRKRAD